MLKRLEAWLFSTEPAAGLAAFRILWGVLMAWESLRYLIYGWLHSDYVAPPFLFAYPGFGWVGPLGAVGMHAVGVAMVLAGVLVALGLAYRVASGVFFVAHTYTFLLSAENYLNHGYLIALVAGLMLLAPAHRTLSLDAVLRPRIAAAVGPRWPRALLRAQLGIVYVFGALGKLDADWLVHHEPVRHWMKGAAARVAGTPWLLAIDRIVPVTERLHDLVGSEGFTQCVAFGGVVFDLLVVPALLWRRTRPLAVVASVGFHVTNMHLFSIGVFPWLMLAATTLFFEPDWPLRLPFVGPHVRRSIAWIEARGDGAVATVRHAGVWTTLWLAWIVAQLLVPLRHVLYPGDVAWTEEGHAFSWRMKLRSKRGTVRYRLVDTVSGETWTVDPAEELTPRQLRKMAGKPELIRQYANHLVHRQRARDGREVEVYVDAFASLNYRTPQRLVDPGHELGHEPWSWGAQPWVLPMTPSEPSRAEASR